MTPMGQSERKGLVERLQQFARWVIEETVFEDGSGSVDGGDVQTEASKLGLLTETEYNSEVHGESDIVEPGDPWFVFSDLLSSGAPMPEEVKALLAEAASDKWIFTGSLALDNLVARLAACVERQSAHVVHLTRKVAEAEGRVNDMSPLIHRFSNALIDAGWPQGATLQATVEYIQGKPLSPLSRPQETDAVLAEAVRLLHAQRSFDKHGGMHGAVLRNDIDAFLRSRPSPGPATETDRRDGNIARAIGLLAKAQGKANIENWRDDVFSARQLLASVRPKAEGV